MFVLGKQITLLRCGGIFCVGAGTVGVEVSY